jgi:probable selenium-dependent hydroxylase accessory protein YqeC
MMFRLARELSAGGDSVLTTTTTNIWIPSKDQSEHVIVSPSQELVLERAKHILPDNLHITAAAHELTSQKKLKGFEPKFINDLQASGLFRWILVEADGAAGRPIKAPAQHEPVIPMFSKWVIGMIGMDAVAKPLTEKWVFRAEIFSSLTGLSIGEPLTPDVIATMLMHAKGIMKGCPRDVNRMIFLNRAECCNNGIEIGREIVKIIRNSRGYTIKRIIIGNILRNPAVVEYHDII